MTVRRVGPCIQPPDTTAGHVSAVGADSCVQTLSNQHPYLDTQNTVAR